LASSYMLKAQTLGAKEKLQRKYHFAYLINPLKISAVLRLKSIEVTLL